MAIVLVATPGASNANTYATLAEAETYHESRPFVDDWTGSDDDKNRALAMATRLLDHWYDWNGYPTNTNPAQALQWPRNSVLDHLQWSFLSSSAIPQDLKNATAEYARQLLVADRSADNQVQAQGLKSLTAGPVSLAFKDDFAIKVVPDSVVSMIWPWWGTLRGTGLTRPLHRA